jgi:hypothetical protein
MRTWHKRFLSICLPVVLLFLAFAIFLHGAHSTQNYHVDEGNWISVGNISFEHFFVERDFRHSDWKKNFNTWGAFQPQIGKYIIGGFLHARGFGDATHYFFDFAHPLDWNREQGNVPGWEIVRAGRFPVAALGAGLCVLLFMLAWRVGGALLCGAIAFFLALGNPLIASLSKVCLIDVPAQFFLVLTVVAVLGFLRATGGEKRRGVVQTILWALAIGLSAGCAIGVKLNNLLLFPFIILLFAYVMANRAGVSVDEREEPRERRKRQRILLIVLGAVILITLLVFYASNPFLYDDPIGGMRHMFRLRNILRWYQKVEPEAALATPAAQIGFVFYRSFWTYGTLRAIFHLPLDAVFFLLGLIRLMKRGRAAGMEQRLYGGAMVLWFAIALLGTAVWIPLDWDRYYVPVVPSIIVIESVGATAIVRLVAQLRKARSGENRDDV